MLIRRPPSTPIQITKVSNEFCSCAQYLAVDKKQETDLKDSKEAKFTQTKVANQSNEKVQVQSGPVSTEHDITGNLPSHKKPALGFKILFTNLSFVRLLTVKYSIT